MDRKGEKRHAQPQVVKPDEKVGLNLTAAERKTILKDVEYLDDDYEHALRETPADQDIEFTLGDWDYLGGEICCEADDVSDQMRKKRLNSVFARIEELLVSGGEIREGLRAVSARAG